MATERALDMLPTGAAGTAAPCSDGGVSQQRQAVCANKERVVAVAPMVRFLCYPEEGGSLPQHVDLPRTVRVAPSSSSLEETKLQPTTHTFLIYLSDCKAGGSTLLLSARDGDGPLAACGGVAPGARETLAAVKPLAGRIMLMPHACPHSAAPVRDAPKLLIRGELLLR